MSKLHPNMPDNYIISFNSYNKIYNTESNYYLAGFNTQQYPNKLEYNTTIIDCLKILIEYELPGFAFILWNKTEIETDKNFPVIDSNFKKFIYDRLTKESKKLLGNPKYKDIEMIIVSHDIESFFLFEDGILSLDKLKNEKNALLKKYMKIPEKILGELSIIKSRAKTSTPEKLATSAKSKAKTPTSETVTATKTRAKTPTPAKTVSPKKSRANKPSPVKMGTVTKSTAKTPTPEKSRHSTRRKQEK